MKSQNPSQINSSIKKMKNKEQNLNSFILPIYNKSLYASISEKGSNFRDFWNDSFLKKDTSDTNFLNIGVLIATFLLMIGAAFLVYELQPSFEQYNLEQLNSVWGMAFIMLSLTLLVYKASFFIFKVYLYLSYKAIKSVSDEELPTCTIIVPAYNEGRLVWDTLKSVANSDYPEHKLQILAIDDGSKDDTFSWIQRAKAELGDRVEIYQQPKNMGKRHALYRGFKLGKGDIFITVDSDSIVI